MNYFDPNKLAQAISNETEYQIIDIREKYELDIVTIGAENIPMEDLMENQGLISKEKQVVVFCKSGSRADAFVDLLTEHYGYSNLHSLKGGILGYIEEVEPSLPFY